jgi:cyanophycinase
MSASMTLFGIRQLQHSMIGILCFLSMNSTMAETSPDKPPIINGSLVIIGGALRTDNAAVWQRIVEQAGGKGAKIAVIPVASSHPERSGNTAANALNQYGADAFVVPLSVSNQALNYQEVARDPKWLEQLAQARGVYFTGGDQGRITQALLQPDGKKTPMLEGIWKLYRNGGVIAGTSAGAAIMSSTMFYDAKAVLPTLKLGVTDGKDIAPGLGFIGPDVFIDQHLIIRGRFARMLPAMLKKNYQLGLGIDENSALVISKRNEVEVIGYKGAILLDLSKASTDASQPDFNVSNVNISYLDHGDKFNLASKLFTPSADKLAGKVDPTKPYNEEALFYPDILANTTAVDLMFNLIDNRHNAAIGLAFGEGKDARPDLGFEFKFSKTPESFGYNSSSSSSYSVMNIRLDIRPVTMQLPLYH